MQDEVAIQTAADMEELPLASPVLLIVRVVVRSPSRTTIVLDIAPEQQGVIPMKLKNIASPS